jgi:hypothetical protein
MIPLNDQIKEAQREVALRKQTYPRLVTIQQMTQEQADWHLAVMEEIVQTLMRLEKAQEQRLGENPGNQGRDFD